MMRAARLLFLVVLGAGLPVRAFAGPEAPVADAGAPRAAASGLAVLAVGDSMSAAWPLARGIYARDALRPAGVDEAHARVLAGEPPPPGAAQDLVDLAETRAAIHGEDAPSRQLLSATATSLNVRGIVVVMTTPGAPVQARVFMADAAMFDAALYAPDAPAGGDLRGGDAGGAGDAGPAATPADGVAWAGAVASLERAYGVRAPTLSAPPLATQPVAPGPRDKDRPHDKDAGSRPFYTSPWFWGAIGAAAIGGTAVYFATRDNSSSTIHLQLQVPK